MSSSRWDEARAALLKSARDWIRRALTAWVDEDLDQAATSAPIGVELLGKAALWTVNTLLLAPLDQSQEASFVALASDPELNSPRRTIGLQATLARLSLLYKELPLSTAQRKRLIDCRNGAIHVGVLRGPKDATAEQTARHVLADSLQVCDFLLERLGVNRDEFLAHQLGAANDLLRRRQTDLEQRIGRRLLRARRDIESFHALHGDDDLWLVTVGQLEASAGSTLSAEDFGIDLVGIEQACPVCAARGRLFGRIDLIPDVEIEGGYDGPEYYAGWLIEFFPRAFACNVCKLVLNTPAELEAGELSAARRQVYEDDIGPDFNAEDWARTLYGIDD